MRNKHALLLRIFCGAALCALASPVWAQNQNIYVPDPFQDRSLTVQPGDIEQGTLDAPVAYDAGLIDIRSGGLDPNLWQGTTASLATRLIEKAPLNSSNPVIRDMVAAVLLSSGIPPEGDEESLKIYESAKLHAVAGFADVQMLEALMARSGPAARTPILQADLSLRKNNIEQACELSDTMTEGRADVFWSRIRTLCHVSRDELPAAEITADLLRRGDYENEAFFDLVQVLIGGSRSLPDGIAALDPINRMLYQMAARKLDFARAEQALDAEADRELRLAALFKFLAELSNEQIEQVFSDLAFDPEDLEASSSFDLDSVIARKTVQGTAQLFLLARAQGDSRSAVQAFSALLERGRSFGNDSSALESRLASLFENELQTWPANEKVKGDIGFFARQAIADNDGLALQSLFTAMPNGPEKFRLALAADALNNGFLLAPFSSEIEKGLKADKNQQAVRDSFLVLALGSQISEAAMEILPKAEPTLPDVLSAGDKAVLKANAKSRQTAQFILRLAPILDKGSLSAADLAFMIEQMTSLGLPSYAARLAAQDFIADL
jgi:hypothetical protein